MNSKQILHMVLMLIVAAVGVLALGLDSLNTAIWCTCWHFIFNFCEI